MMIQSWIQNQIETLKSFEGSFVEKVLIYEMAIIECEGQHLFEHSDCPFIQANTIYLWLDGDRLIKIYTYQNDCEWGIFSAKEEFGFELDIELEDSSIFRLNYAEDFPIGIINMVSIVQSKAGDISEVKLVINEKEILLKSGEVYENLDGSISIKSNDESVLVFVDSQNAKLVKFDA